MDIPWANTRGHIFSLFSPLDQLSNGLMPSLCVRRPRSYLRNPSVDFFVIWHGHSLGQYPGTYFSLFALNAPRAFRPPQYAKNVEYSSICSISQKRFSNFFLFRSYSFLIMSTIILEELYSIEFLEGSLFGVKVCWGSCIKKLKILLMRRFLY